MSSGSQLCWGDDQHCLVSLTPGRFMNSHRICDFMKDRIIVTGQWQNRKVAPLVVVHLLSNGSGPTFILSGKAATDEKSARNFTALQKLHKECQENDKVLVAAMGDDTEIVIAPVNCQGGIPTPPDKTLPRFWGYTLIRGALGVGADLLDTGRLPIVLDLDETLVLAHTQSSLTNRINALMDDIPRLKSNLDICQDPTERKSEEGRIRAAENEKCCMERDLQCLKDFTESNYVQWDGKMVYAINEPVIGEHGEELQRPIIRLSDKCFYTRIDPNRTETSMLIRIRPGWEDLRKYLAGGESVDKKHRVGVCTAAERGYALEAWRLLDPTMEIIPQAEREHRIICMGKQKKSLFRALHLGPWSEAPLPAGLMCESQNIGPLVEGASEMPLAIVVDDRVDVWEPRNHDQLIKVRPFLHYRDSIWSNRLPTDNDVTEIQRILGLLQSARSNLYYELQEVLTPYIHKSYMAGPWNEEAEAMVVKTLDRAVSIVGFLNPNYTRPAPPINLPMRCISPEVSLCPQDPRELRPKPGNMPNPAQQTSCQVGKEVDTSTQPIHGQENTSSKQITAAASNFLSSGGVESSYRCSMLPQDPRREWRAQLEKGSQSQVQSGVSSDDKKVGMPSSMPSSGNQKRKYDQVQGLGEPGHVLNGQRIKTESGVWEPGNKSEAIGSSAQGTGVRLEVHSKVVGAKLSINQPGCIQREVFGGSVSGLAGKMACVQMEPAGSAPQNTLNQMPSFPQQSLPRGVPMQGIVQQGLPSCTLPIPIGAQVGLAGIGQVLTPQARPGGFQVYRQDGKLHHATVVQGTQQQQNGDQTVNLRQPGIPRPLIGTVRVQNAPGNALHPLTVQHIGGVHGHHNQHSVVIQNVMGQMGLPQQVGGGGPGHVSVAQVRVPDATGLSKGSQRGVQSYVVIKPHDQHQMQVVPGQIQVPQQRQPTTQPGFVWPKQGNLQTRPPSNPPQPPFYSLPRPGAARQQYPLPQVAHIPSIPPPNACPGPDAPLRGQQNPRPPGFMGRSGHDQQAFLPPRGPQGDPPRPPPYYPQASTRGHSEPSSMGPRPPRYHNTEGAASLPPNTGDINPISQLNQLAQREKTELLFGGREEANGMWQVSVSCKGEVMGMATCRSRRLGKRLASLMALEKFGAIDKREYDQRSRALMTEEDLVDEDKWTPCELLEGLYPGRVTYSDSGDPGAERDRSRVFMAEVSVRTEDGSCLRREINAWGMNKKKARNTLANKMLKVRKSDSMVPERDQSPNSRAFLSSGGDERVPKRMRLDGKEGKEHGEVGNGAGPGMRGYLEQLEDALDEEEAEEGEIQE